MVTSAAPRKMAKGPKNVSANPTVSDQEIPSQKEARRDLWRLFFRATSS
jgi:hypothetical protein